MSLFALVHGGAHGGWCWEMVVPELERRGHRVVAPDLPFEEPDAGAAEWARTVISAVDEAVSSDDADVVVVGHSLAGLAVPVVASWRPVRRMVFLAAQVPVPGQRYVDYLATQPDAVIFDGTPRPDDELAPGGGVSWLAAREGFYQDLDEPVARRAWERLRAQGMSVFTEVCPIEVWPDIPSTYILMRDDRAVGPSWSRRVTEERLHSVPIELDGGHSPFYSRPVELAEVLANL